MSHYIITGASGHIGNNLVRMLNEKEPDAKITALTRRKVTKELENTVCEQIIGDISSYDFLNSQINEDDIVIHLACLIDLTNKRAEETHKINYEGTKLICDVCRQKKIKKFIYVGSVDGIYREANADKICEPDDYYPDKIEGNYGKSKAKAMKYVLNSIKNDENFNASIVMPSAVIGINDRKPSAVGKVVLDTLNGKPEFGIKGGYNFVDVRDVCKAIIFLANSNIRDQFILSGENVSVKELYGAINELKGYKRKPILIPYCVVNLFLPFIKVLNKITLKALRESHNYSCDKAKKAFGYSVTPFSQTLKDTITWFESQK